MLLISGSPRMVDYTPGTAKTGGSVIVIGVNPYVAHRDIAANELSALAARGGVYSATADGALAEGVKVYWDAATNKVTATAGANKHFGYIAPGSSASGDGSTVSVIHAPAN